MDGLLENYQWNHQNTLTKNEENLASMVQNPIVTKHLFDDYRQKRHLTEVISLLCVSKTNPEDVKFVGIDQTSSTKTTASISINNRQINQQCDPKKYDRLWFHTHGPTTSAPSLMDNIAARTLFHEKFGHNMCATGTDGATCIVKRETDKAPSILTASWNKTRVYPKFLHDLSPFKDKKQIKSKNQIKQSEKSKIVNGIDVMTCNTHSSGLTCQHFEIGNDSPIAKEQNYKSITINGKVDVQAFGNNNFLLITQPTQGQLKCLIEITDNGDYQKICS